MRLAAPASLALLALLAGAPAAAPQEPVPAPPPQAPDASVAPGTTGGLVRRFEPLARERRLETGQDAPRGYLGVRVSEGSGPGVRIDQVEPDTPAAGLGLQAGDRIVAVDGRELSDPDELVEAIGRHAAGETIELRFRREGDERTVRATLAPHPLERAAAGTRRRARTGEELPGRLEELFGREEEELGRWSDELRRRHGELLERSERRWEALRGEPGAPWDELQRRLDRERDRRRERLDRFLAESETREQAFRDELHRWLGERLAEARDRAPRGEPGRPDRPEPGRPGGPDAPGSPGASRGPSPGSSPGLGSGPGADRGPATLEAEQHEALNGLRGELERLRAEVRELRRALDDASREDDRER